MLPILRYPILHDVTCTLQLYNSHVECFFLFVFNTKKYISVAYRKCARGGKLRVSKMKGGKSVYNVLTFQKSRGGKSSPRGGKCLPRPPQMNPALNSICTLVFCVLPFLTKPLKTQRTIIMCNDIVNTHADNVYVIGYEKGTTSRKNSILRLQHHVKVHSLRFLLQFVSLN